MSQYTCKKRLNARSLAQLDMYIYVGPDMEFLSIICLLLFSDRSDFDMGQSVIIQSTCTFKAAVPLLYRNLPFQENILRT